MEKFPGSKKERTNKRTNEKKKKNVGPNTQKSREQFDIRLSGTKLLRKLGCGTRWAKGWEPLT